LVWTVRSRPKVRYGGKFVPGAHIWTEMSSPTTIPTTPQKIADRMNPSTVRLS
jgi:hypothetical protein